MSPRAYNLPGLEAPSRPTRLQSIRALLNPEFETRSAFRTVIPAEFIQELTEMFPDRCPGAETSVEEIHRKQGEQRVIQVIVNSFVAQNQEGV